MANIEYRNMAWLFTKRKWSRIVEPLSKVFDDNGGDVSKALQSEHFKLIKFIGIADEDYETWIYENTKLEYPYHYLIQVARPYEIESIYIPTFADFMDFMSSYLNVITMLAHTEDS